VCSAHQAHILGTKTVFGDFEKKNSFVSLFEPKYTKCGETLFAEKSGKLFYSFWYIQICTHWHIFENIHIYTKITTKLKYFEKCAFGCQKHSAKKK